MPELEKLGSGKAFWFNKLPEGESIVALKDIEIATSKNGGKYCRAKLAESKTHLFYVCISGSQARDLLEFVGYNVLITKKLDKINGYVSDNGKQYNTYKYIISEVY